MTDLTGYIECLNIVLVLHEVSPVAGEAGDLRVLALIGDLKTPVLVTEEGTIVTNGYELNLDPESIACMISYDENGNPMKYTFNKKFVRKIIVYNCARRRIWSIRNDSLRRNFFFDAQL